ncbi:HMG box family protein [Trichomonas vaginalis G3]|uniref:HMG box family protein n=1 Tax=Trichomonas vaginalis (strain ATCC PRA-98 / G3) TaxID=412133 RepID=A2EHK4_TRIV3|nr:SRY (sex determining region Y)-box family [Trichomonas vaginalis G3]EAY07891.1 HMG box family protein [Trichomonas vaginalis G3]KAI5514150.1 SRY (sex determining region Y)-box family [Trichomonas vaginalis G3]|eukprot:XP_001320114.1 HMG box family protein [Trichomonas vaginalis G3]
MPSNMGGMVPQQQWNQPPPTYQQPPPAEADDGMGGEDGDNSKRPPNAFILYSQAMRPQVRQENPSLSNTECSRLLGKMWKEVPNDIKLQYKQRASAMQADFKRDHPDYTYRKARRKRALNELLTKSSQVAPGMYPPAMGGDSAAWPPQGGVFPMQGMGMPGFSNLPGQPSLGSVPSVPGMPSSQPPAMFAPPAVPGTQLSTSLNPTQSPAATASQPQNQPLYQMPGFPGMLNTSGMFGFTGK